MMPPAHVPGGVQSFGGAAAEPRRAPASVAGRAGLRRLAPPLCSPRLRLALRPRLLRVQHLDLRQRAANLLGLLGIQQVDDRPSRLDPHPRLLEVALVLLGDPAGSQVEHADDALQQQVLDADRAQLLLDPRAELLLALRRLLALGRWRWTRRLRASCD